VLSLSDLKIQSEKSFSKAELYKIVWLKRTSNYRHRFIIICVKQAAFEAIFEDEATYQPIKMPCRWLIIFYPFF
jgi:hypothetical protein